MILFYRILTYLLIPFVSIIALSGLIILPTALANPAMLLSVFVVAAIVIYFINSFRFLHAGLVEGKALPTRLRDWIKVNAFVTLFLAVQSGAMLYLLLSKSPQLAQLLQTARDMQAQQPLPMTGSLDRIILTGLWAFSIAGLLLGVHVLLSLRLVRRYAAYFCR